MCVSQWTVAGAAGPHGAPVVEHVMLVLGGDIAQKLILLQRLGVVPAKETELGLIPAALNPALVSRVTQLVKFFFYMNPHFEM